MRRNPSLPIETFRRLKGVLRPNVQVLPPPRDVHVDRDVPITTKDDVVLRANVFRPIETERGAQVPVLMSAHPYGKDAMPCSTRSGRGVNLQYRILPQPAPVRFSSWTSFEAPDPASWVRRGYAVVNLDVRGAGTSEGVAQLFSDQEARDYAEAIAWVAAQPWSTGRVGLIGVSYLAVSQYKVAALRPPHLAAICPWEGFSDLYRDFTRPGGVREDGFSTLWSTLVARVARVDGSLRHELATRPTRDRWYEALTPDLERIEVPMLVCGSFSDHNLHTRGSFEAFRRAGSEWKWLYTHRQGKWSTFYDEDVTATQASFFDWALKGEDNGWDATPPVRLAIHDEGSAPIEVRHEEAWPPPDLRWAPCRLDLRGMTLVAADTPPAPAAVSVDTRGRGLTFDWKVPIDLDVIGPMALRIHVGTVDIDDVHLFARVRKIRDGVETTFEGSFGFSGAAVTLGWQRTTFRDLDEGLSRPWQPVHTFMSEEPLPLGEIVRIDMELRPHATRFRAGDVLRLDVRGTWPYPRNPVTGQLPTGYAKSPKGRFILYAGGGWDSYLLMGTRHPTS